MEPVLKKSNFILRYFGCILLFLGAMGTLMIWWTFPHGREEHSFLSYFFQIVIFVIIVLGISFFPMKFRYSYLLMNLPIVALIMYIIPKISYYAVYGMVDKFYNDEFMLLYPTIIFAICLAYRIGGGTSGHCIKTGLNGLIILFSGLLDLMWFVVNGIDYKTGVSTIPHIEMILGRVPSFMELIGFIAIHGIMMIIIMILPLDSWIEWMMRPKRLNRPKRPRKKEGVDYE